MKYFFIYICTLLIFGCASTENTSGSQDQEHTEIVSKETSPEDTTERVSTRKTIVKVGAVYPKNLREAGVTGWTIAEYDVGINGIPQNIKIIESNPPGVFDKVSIDSVKRYRYPAYLVDGVPTVAKGVQTKITFGNPE